MIIICGRTIAEVERDLEMAKVAIATGAPVGVGNATMADVEQAMRGLYTAMGEHNAPINNPNYDPCDGCPHWKSNNECEDEEEDICPECGGYMVDGYCEDCGYPGEDEDEDELTPENLAGLTAEEVDRITDRYGLPKAWASVMKQILGL